MVGHLHTGLYAGRTSPPLLREIRLQLFQDHVIGHILELPLPHIPQAHETHLPATRLLIALHDIEHLRRGSDPIKLGQTQIIEQLPLRLG